jgi:hypothetical protein
METDSVVVLTGLGYGFQQLLKHPAIHGVL